MTSVQFWGIALALLAATQAAAASPNFVVILADDLGYGEVGDRHVGDVATPNIDALAEAGVVFTNGYVTAAECVPSRAGLLTGRYQQEFGIYINPEKPRPPTFGLPAAVATLPEVLRARGYATGMVGKWHLGNKPEDHPLRHGFDEFFGVLESDHPYYGEQEQSSKPFHNPILRGTTPVAARGYLTDTFAAEAAAFIATHASRPFFLYVPFTATHGPLQAKPELLTKLSFIKDDKRRLFAAVLASLDEAVGTITAALRKARIARNTVVVFLGDNGCASGHGCSNRPLRGGKYSLYEGGIRAPFILAWPGQVTAGRRYAKPVAAFDLFATFVHAAGGTPAGVVDGVNLLPFLQGRTGSPHPVLFWGGSKAGAIRKGNWKLIGTELYDLSTDVRETHDVAAAHPSVVASLRSARSRWLSGLAPALW